MSNLGQIIDYTNLFQDVELATAISQLKNNPVQLQQFLQEQQSKVFNDVTKQKDSTFQKVYGDLNRAAQVQESVLMYDKRNKELADIQQQIYDNQKNSATAITEDKTLAERKYEMNQWSINDKNDTLFVFSALLIMLSGLTIITVLWRMGLLSSALWAFLAAPLIIIFVLIVIYRSHYTNVFRDKRYWNRRTFDSKYKTLDFSLCPGALHGLESEFGSLKGDVEKDVGSIGKEAQSIESTASQDVKSAMSTASKDISSAGKEAKSAMSTASKDVSSESSKVGAYLNKL